MGVSRRAWAVNSLVSLLALVVNGVLNKDPICHVILIRLHEDVVCECSQRTGLASGTSEQHEIWDMNIKRYRVKKIQVTEIREMFCNTLKVML